MRYVAYSGDGSGSYAYGFTLNVNWVLISHIVEREIGSCKYHIFTLGFDSTKNQVYTVSDANFIHKLYQQKTIRSKKRLISRALAFAALLKLNLEHSYKVLSCYVPF